MKELLNVSIGWLGCFTRSEGNSCRDLRSSLLGTSTRGMRDGFAIALGQNTVHAFMRLKHPPNLVPSDTSVPPRRVLSPFDFITICAIRTIVDMILAIVCSPEENIQYSDRLVNELL